MVNLGVWRWWLMVVYLGLQGTSLMAHADEWQDASKVVGETTDAMLSVLAVSNQQTVSEISPAIDGVLAPVVDFRTIAKGVMAKYYRRAQPEQFETFVGVFRDSLVQAYTNAVVTFAIDSYRVQKNPGADGRTGREKVWVKVYAGSSVYDIHYTMSAKSGNWKVTNVVLDGVNLGLAFRNQFATAMRSNDNNMDVVIANWNAKAY
ncbi:MAG: ABC transporter substrate-binding protein [Gammaproteobacteria bacterium]|jgi:phospholipid transport system substrate-binding protein|nr:ABC transporter substrate-binding protein [Gammaproteobacteria bacterium]